MSGKISDFLDLDTLEYAHRIEIVVCSILKLQNYSFLF